MAKKGQQIGKAEAVNMLEIGTTGLDFSGGLVYEEYLTQLIETRGRRTYREMGNDAIVGAMLFALEMMIRGVSWSVESDDTSPEGEKRAAYLESIPDDMSHSWSSFLGEWMAAPTYGFAPFETVFKRRLGDSKDPTKRSRYNDGLVGVRKLAIRHPDTLARWEFDEAGGVQAMTQRSAPDYRPRTIPIEKLLLFTVGQQKNNPEGTSLLRRAFVAWYRKKNIEQIEAIGIERELNGLPVFYVPAQWTRANATTDDKANLEYVKKMGRRLRADEQACVILPSLFDNNQNQLLKFDLASTQGRRAIDTAQAKEYYSRQIAMTILADVILLGHEKVGSFGLATSKASLFAAGLTSLLGGIADTVNRHLVSRLFRLNGWPTDATMPRLVPGDVERVSLEELGGYIANLAGAGMSLFPTETGALEHELLRLGDLPADDVTPKPPPTAGEAEEDDMEMAA